MEFPFCIFLFPFFPAPKVFSEDGLNKIYLDAFTQPADKSIGARTFGPTYDVNFTDISKLTPRSKIFSGFTKAHTAAVHEMEGIYEENSKDVINLMKMAQNLRTTHPELHPRVWLDGFLRSQADINPKSLNLPHPNAIHLLPTNFIPGLKEVYDAGKKPPTCLIVDGTITNDNPESELWYFREDVLLNAHHYVWHFVWSLFFKTKIPRRGEFFAWFHHDLLARYSAERIAHKFKPLTAIWLDKTNVIEEPYNPHLKDGISSRNWTPRPANTKITKEALGDYYWKIYLRQPEIYARLRAIMETKTVFKDGKFHPVVDKDVGNEVEEALEGLESYWEEGYYGALGAHNEIHDIIAYLNTPEGDIGVLGDHTTAMRDPVFYRIHLAWDEVWRDYKNNYEPAYELRSGDHPLAFDKVRVEEITIGNLENDWKRNNKLQTFFSERKSTFEGGLDYGIGGEFPEVNVCIKHLDHEEFIYVIKVMNEEKIPRINAFIRIFMAPKYKNLTTLEKYSYDEQRQNFFTMDSFVHPLGPGQNIITRYSQNSTLTVPWPKSIKELRESVDRNERELVDCGCGFPHHLLLPMGTKDGVAFDIFVIVTDADKDWVGGKEDNERKCIPSHVHCGIWGLENPVGFPDAKPLGFPFDRRPYTLSNGMLPLTIEEFVSELPNAAVQPITIYHREKSAAHLPG